MSLLLDTHVFLWWLDEHPRLKENATTAIENGSTLVYVSAATIWEITIKRRLGRLKAGKEDLVKEIAENNFMELPLSARHAHAAGALPLHHEDPFDRALIAQAQLERLTLVTHDKAFSRYDVPVLWT